MQLTVVESLAGCGKTASLYNEVQANSNDEVLVLSFNRHLREEAEENLVDIPNVSIHTVHSLAFQIAVKGERVPEGFDKDKDGGESEPSNYNELIVGAIETCLHQPEQARRAIGKIDRVLIDEYQDLRGDYIALLQQVVELSKPHEVVVYGDPLQRIYGYQNKYSKSLKIDGMDTRIWRGLAENFENVEADWKDVAEKVTRKGLTYGYRSTPAIQKTVNHFLDGHDPNSQGPRYTPREIGLEKTPEIHIFQHKEDEYEWVMNTIEGMGSEQEVCILGVSKFVLWRYEQVPEKFKDRNVSVSSIHKMKGSQADVVILVGVYATSKLEQADESSLYMDNSVAGKVRELSYECDEDLRNVLYTGLSRARSELYACSSYPESPLEVLSDCESVSYQDHRYQEHKGWKRLPRLKPNAHFTLNKLSKSMIDSIDLKVKDIDAPFHSYIPAGEVPRHKGKFQRGFMTHVKGVPVTIIRNQRAEDRGSICFEFRDLNLLKRNGYSDLHIMKFVTNFVMNFFNHQIGPENINVDRIDLCKHLYFDTAVEAKDALGQVDESIRQGKYKSIRDNENTVYGDGSMFNSWSNHTYYANLLGSSVNGKWECGLRIYRVDGKNNSKGLVNGANRALSKRNTWKIEYKLGNRVPDRNYVFGGNSNCKYVIEQIWKNSEYLYGVWKCIDEHFGFR